MKLSNSKNALISWSGGKDSCYALYKARQKGVKPKVLLTMLNEEGTLSRSNAVTVEILKAQSNALNIPIIFASASWEEYENIFIATLKNAKLEYELTNVVFGDLDIEKHKNFEEEASSAAGLQAILPIWGMSRNEAAKEVLNLGIRAKLSVIRNDIIDEQYLGSEYDDSIFEYFKKNNIDICGENGEFHTLVYDSPIFNDKIPINLFQKCRNSIYSFAMFRLF